MHTYKPTNHDEANFSAIALGFWRLHNWNMNPGQLLEFVSQSLDLGIYTFDHADIYCDYSCEEIFGRAIGGQSSLRVKMQLISKCGIRLVSGKRPQHANKTYDTSFLHIMQSAENSLKALQTDYLDLLMIHRPDPLMDADETARAFSKLRDDGKVLHFGVSNFMPSQFELLQSRLDFPLVTNQVEISVLKTEAFFNGVLDQCQQKRVRPMAWSPLGGGSLFHSSEPQIERLCSVMEEICCQLGDCRIEQLALAWLLSHPSGIVPVLGTGNSARLRLAAESLKIRLTREQWFSILMASTGQEIP